MWSCREQGTELRKVDWDLRDAEGGRDYDYDNNMRRRPGKFQQKFLGEIGCSGVLKQELRVAADWAWEKFGGAAVESLISTQM